MGGQGSSASVWNAACSESPAVMLKAGCLVRGSQPSRHLSCKEQRQNKIHRRNSTSTKSSHVAITVTCWEEWRHLGEEKVSHCEYTRCVSQGGREREKKNREQQVLQTVTIATKPRPYCKWTWEGLHETHTHSHTHRAQLSSQIPQRGKQAGRAPFNNDMVSIHKEIVSILMLFSLFEKFPPKFE